MKITNLLQRATALVLVLFLLQAPQLLAQVSSLSGINAGAPKSLHITILDGDDALNNIRQRTAREPIVQVEDENHKPVAAAVVLFTIHTGPKGAGGSFAGGSTLAVVTGLDGQAIAKGLLTNKTKGTYTITVQATVGAVTTSAIITQTNVLTSLSSAGGSQGGVAATHHLGGFFGGHFWLIAGGIAAAGGAIVATIVVTHSQGASITPGQGTVKP